VDKLENGDVLVVTKLDRLARNAIDVRATVEALEGAGGSGALRCRTAASGQNQPSRYP
jgi:hypothetical protein